MTRVLEKVERRLGERLFLKSERCVGPKCALVRRSSIPGAHGKSRRKRRRGGSEFGLLLNEKQKIRYIYGLDDKDLARYNSRAAKKSGVFNENIIQLLERRLDNTVFRLGFAESRRVARQAVGHKHVTVNGRAVNIPSYLVNKDDIIALKEKTLASQPFSELNTRLKNYKTPAWLALDKENKTGTVLGLPSTDGAGLTVEISKIKEFYSK